MFSPKSNQEGTRRQSAGQTATVHPITEKVVEGRVVADGEKEQNRKHVVKRSL